MILPQAIFDIALSAAPWLMVGLAMAGLIKGLISKAQLSRWIGGRGLGRVVRAADTPASTPTSSCVGGSSCGCADQDSSSRAPKALGSRLASVLRFAFTNILDDISPWVAGGSSTSPTRSSRCRSRCPPGWRRWR